MPALVVHAPVQMMVAQALVVPCFLLLRRYLEQAGSCGMLASRFFDAFVH